MDESGGFRRHRREIASRFLQLGATSYGGPATMGIMQAELQDSDGGYLGSDFSRGCRW